MRIRYGIDLANDRIISQNMESMDIAIPQLNDSGIKQMSFLQACQLGIYTHFRWTRKVPVATKNTHRQYWGMKPLQVK